MIINKYYKSFLMYNLRNLSMRNSQLKRTLIQNLEFLFSHLDAGFYYASKNAFSGSPLQTSLFLVLSF